MKDYMSCKVLMLHSFFTQIGSSPPAIIHRIPSAHVERASPPWADGNHPQYDHKSHAVRSDVLE